MAELTINLVTYQRYEEIKRAIESILAQTNKNFVLDIWNDGPDDKKRDIILSYKDERIKYSENPERANLYGHDMRNKSLAACNTLFWCTTNDDNVVSPLFVEKVLARENIEFDIIKMPIAMANLFDKESQQDSDRVYFTKNYMYLNNYGDVLTKRILSGETRCQILGELIPILKSHTCKINDVDAASFVVKTDFAKKAGGWGSTVFEADGIFYEKIIALSPKIKYIEDVLVVHF